MEEIFDVLEENGEYSGKIASRGECHKYGLWHKAIAVFIINSKEQVLLQKRSKNKKMWPNMWDISSGGHVLTGEFGYQAAIRETKEELGIDLAEENIRFIGSVISNNKRGGIFDRHFNEYYIVKMEVDEKILVLQEEEVSSVKWIDKDEIIKRVKNNFDGITDKQGCWEYLVKYFEMNNKK